MKLKSGSALGLSPAGRPARPVPSKMLWDLHGRLWAEAVTKFAVFPVPDFLFQKELFAARDTGEH